MSGRNWHFDPQTICLSSLPELTYIGYRDWYLDFGIVSSALHMTSCLSPPTLRVTLWLMALDLAMIKGSGGFTSGRAREVGVIDLISKKHSQNLKSNLQEFKSYATIPWEMLREVFFCQQSSVSSTSRQGEQTLRILIVKLEVLNMSNKYLRSNMQWEYSFSCT